MSFETVKFSDWEKNSNKIWFSEYEKSQIADFLEEYFKDLTNKYQCLPVTVDTLGKKKRKLELEGLLDEVQGYIYLMRSNKRVKKANFPPHNSKFRQCFDGETDLFETAPKSEAEKYVFW